MAKSDSNKGVKVDLTTGIGILSFPHLFKAQAENNKNDKGEPQYDVQIIIPKTQRDDIRAILKAIKEVGESKWGERWKQVKMPLRDGDKERDELTEDGSTKGEKYPERDGCYFLNARSSRPVGVYRRDRTPVEAEDFDEVYGGCKGRISVTFYAYSSNGNHGVAAGLNGVQKVSDGEAFGGSRPTVETMFDMIGDDEGDDLGDDLDGLDDEPEDEVEEAPAKPAKKAAAKKGAAKGKSKAKAKAEADDDLDDMYDDL